MANGDSFTYNRFQALDEAYRTLYEKEECDVEDDVSKKERDAIKGAVKKHTDEKHDEDEENENENENDEENDEKKSNKKEFHSFLKKSKVEEDACEFLMNEGYVNNLVSAEIMLEHMSDEWIEAILEAIADPAV